MPSSVSFSAQVVPLTEEHCKWFDKFVDLKLSGIVIPVLRRWGRLELDSIDAHLGIAFVDQPHDISLPLNCLYLEGCETRVFQVPLPSKYPLSVKGCPVWPVKRSTKTVIRRRTSVSELLPWLQDLENDHALGLQLVRLLLRVDSSQDETKYSPKRVILVDYEGEEYVHSHKRDDGT